MTERVADALNAAYSGALSQHNTQTTPEHMLAALLQQERGIAPDILKHAGVDVPAFERSAEAAVERLPRFSGASADSAQVTLAPELVAHHELRRRTKPRRCKTNTFPSNTCCWRCRRPAARSANSSAKRASRATNCWKR